MKEQVLETEERVWIHPSNDLWHYGKINPANGLMIAGYTSVQYFLEYPAEKRFGYFGKNIEPQYVETLEIAKAIAESM